MIYEWVGSFFEGFASFTRNRKYGFLDMNGTEVIPPIYESTYNFNYGLFQFREKDLWGFANVSGIVIPAIYTAIREIKDLYRLDKPGSQQIYMDRNGKVVELNESDKVKYRGY